MEPTWISVADTAVKIGLGALIAGISSLVLTTKNHYQSLARELSSRKIRILEDACGDAERYFSSVNYIYNSLGAHAEHNLKVVRPFTDIEAKDLSTAFEKLPDALDARNRAISKVSLLGISEALTHLARYNNVLNEVRKRFNSDEMPTAEQFFGLLGEFQHHRTQFYASCSSYLDRVGTGR